MYRPVAGGVIVSAEAGSGVGGTGLPAVGLTVAMTSRGADVGLPVSNAIRDAVAVVVATEGVAVAVVEGEPRPVCREMVAGRVETDRDKAPGARVPVARGDVGVD